MWNNPGELLAVIPKAALLVAGTALLQHHGSPNPGSGSGFAPEMQFIKAFWKRRQLESWPGVHTNPLGEER